MNDIYEPRYREVWDRTLKAGELSMEAIQKSRYYFEDDLRTPTPKRYDTYGIVALLPMPVDVQRTLSDLWETILESLDHPLAYGVLPEHRHVELLLFSRPEEIFPTNVIEENVERSFRRISEQPPRAFRVSFRYPFMTPDGTIVVPGYPEPETAIEDIRQSIRSVVTDVPTKQSQWFHTSFGRILEPVSRERFANALALCEQHWNEPVASCEIDTLYWTHERRWYMVEKDILHTVKLS